MAVMKVGCDKDYLRKRFLTSQYGDKMFKKYRIHTLIAAFALGTCAVSAQALAAEAFPASPVRIVSSFPPGSISDTISRVVGAKMAESLGQPFLVENKPGANGSVGALYVARAKPDGYTLMMGTNSINAINPSLFKSLNYDPSKDFVPIGMVAEIPALLVARKSLPFTDLKGLIEQAKHQKGSLTYATATATAQVAGETLNQQAGIKLLNVPYRGEPLGLTDLLGGQVDLMILNIPVAYPYIKNGEIKAIAVLSKARAPILPDVPTASETLPGYVIPTGWNALFAPAGTPAPTIQRLTEALGKALQAADVRKQIEATAGTSVSTSTPQELGTRVADDARRWSEMIKAAGIPLQ
jgi:tripartite-type tricarboxylate transporter receptor subunit TctC